MIVLTSTVFALLLGISYGNDCVPRDFGNDGTVCVCTPDYCDTIDSPDPVDPTKYIIYTSNKDGLRFQKTVGDFNQAGNSDSGSVITIDVNTKFQTIIGWGGAFTDSTGINVNSLNESLRKYLLQSYFGEDGLQYSLGRVPIGGTDFSTRPYTYDDNLDTNLLTKFNLTDKDFNYKIPLIKEAISLTKNDLKLFASAWSAPVWMKTNNAFSGLGYLKDEYYQTWADYHVKFLEAYQNEGVNFWGVTTGNEPNTPLVPFEKINSMAWTSVGQGKWVSENFGPTLRKSSFKDIKIMALDDQRIQLPLWMAVVFSVSNAKDYIDGTAVHWYMDTFTPAFFLDATHDLASDKFILATEACNGAMPLQKKVLLGSWKRGELYTDDIIEDLQHWVSGWTDWNMALDVSGGPTYINNNVDSAIIVNASSQEIYKQPMYYALGHFAKFIRPSSVRIQAVADPEDVRTVAFTRPDNATVVIVYNKQEKDVNITLQDKRKGTFTRTVTKQSFNTILYW